MRTVGDVMIPDVHTISPDATIEEAAQEMRDGDFGLMPVGEEDQLLGVITDRDIIIRAVAEGQGSSFKVRDVMSSEPVWAHQDDSVGNAAQIMREHQIRRLPVVDDDQRLVGVVALGALASRTPILDLSPKRSPEPETIPRERSDISMTRCSKLAACAWTGMVLFFRYSARHL